MDTDIDTSYPRPPMLISINLQPDRPQLDGRQIDDLIALYLADIARGSRASTATGYARKLAHFRAWWSAHRAHYGDRLDEAAFADFARHLETAPAATGQPLAWHSRNDVLRRLRQALRWAHGRGMLPVDFSGYVPVVKGGPPAQKPLALDVVAALLEAARLSRFPRRNRAVIAVLAGTGVRCAECAAMRVEDVTVYADGGGYVYLRLTKNDKPRVVGFDAHTGAYLTAWLDRLPAVGPLFPSRTGDGPLSPSGLYKMLRSVAALAGVEARIRGAHDIRRLFATHWQRALPGAGYGQLLQKQLGHSDINQTLKYSLQDVEDVLELMRSQAATPMAKLARLDDK